MEGEDLQRSDDDVEAVSEAVLAIQATEPALAWIDESEHESDNGYDHQTDTDYTGNHVNMAHSADNGQGHGVDSASSDNTSTSSSTGAGTYSAFVHR